MYQPKYSSEKFSVKEYLIAEIAAKQERCNKTFKLADITAREDVTKDAVIADTTAISKPGVTRSRSCWDNCMRVKTF